MGSTHAKGNSPTPLGDRRRTSDPQSREDGPPGCPILVVTSAPICPRGDRSLIRGSCVPSQRWAGWEVWTMASRLGPSWLNRVQGLAGPTHAARLSRYALLADQIHVLEPVLEKVPDEGLKARGQLLKPRARQGESLNG